jgi:hypothetical protein
MATKITQDIIESYLNCKYKGHLKFAGQEGTQSDYGQVMAASRDDVRRLAIDKIFARRPAEAEDVARDIVLTLPALKGGPHSSSTPRSKTTTSPWPSTA